MPATRTGRAVDAVTFGKRRRQRAIDRQLREIDRIEFGDQPTSRSRRRARSGTRALLVLVALGVAAWIHATVGPSGNNATVNSSAPGPVGTITGAPTSTHLASLHRLLPSVQAPSAPAGSYRYLPGQRGARWEPCRPIHYVVRRGGEDRQLDRILASAVAEVSAASGLQFVADGATSELPLYTTANRLSYMPQLYGDRWAPVLVAGSNSSESPSLADAEGRAGPTAWGGSGEPFRYVTGTVSFDTPKMQALLRTPHGADYARQVILHELGHLVGLAHVADKTQVMHPGYPEPPLVHYSDGDRAGLAQLGAVPCYADY